MEPNAPKQVQSAPPCFGLISTIWGVFAAVVIGTLAGRSEIVALIVMVGVPWSVFAIDKVRKCEGRFPDRAYNRHDEPGLYWFARASAVWAAIMLLWGVLIVVDMLFNDGAITGVQMR
ncbi:MAG: hypothetical protein AAGI52_07845 [Bacteroidota bacterium]